MLKYHIWTIGCQMNKAESARIEDFLQQSGYLYTPTIRDANLVIVNSCVVRQNAEDKVMGMLNYLKGIKANHPETEILVTGCFVDDNQKQLKDKYRNVSEFFKPGDLTGLMEYIKDKKFVVNHTGRSQHLERKLNCSALVPIIQGCNNYCSYCIVPYRRGREISRGLNEIIIEVKELANQGVKEITLLGQNVNSYGHDLVPIIHLSQLLLELSRVTDLLRIRFLTNHPKDMNLDLIRTMAEIKKVCKQINLPLQSGNDQILEAMNRHYTKKDYVNLISQIKTRIPEIALSTDVIVGFPGESDEQFEDTLNVIEKIGFDVVHVAMYSPRAETKAAEMFEDNVPYEEKKRRLKTVEALQSTIAHSINSKLIGKTQTVLVEGEKDSKWYGRTESNKLVFFDSPSHLYGQIVNVEVTSATAWSLKGNIA